MPGIVGLVTRLPPPQAKAELVEMMRVMRHEPFYVLRTWMDETLGLYLGWSARQGSFSDAGPHLNETGDVVLVFSGEDYPEPGTRQRLKEQGHTIGDAEASYIVHQYEEDPSFPANLNGRFHGVLIDRRRGSALLFNDRYGMNRVYVHECADGTYFAAEAKAILAARPELRTIDARALAESITLGCVVENRTLFSGIQVLPGGSAWTFQGGRLCRKGSYFNPHEWEDQPTLDSQTFYERTREVFSRTLPRYFAGRERVGVSLTGGLDSRMVMAWQPCAPGTLPSYTWGGPYRDCRDVIVAREVARTCGQTHEVISMGQEFLAGFASYADRAIYLTDGCVDIGLAPDVYMNQRARQIAPVRMTGLYGGEVLRSVRMFKHSLPPAGLFRQELMGEFERARDTYQGLVNAHPLSFAVFRQAPWHHGNSLTLEETQVTMRSPFLDNEFVRTVFQAPSSVTTSNDVSVRLIQDGNAALGRIATDRRQGVNGSLRAHLAHAFQEFTFKAEYAYDYGMPQWLARVDRAVAAAIRTVVPRQAQAAALPALVPPRPGRYVRDILLDPRSLARPYVERTSLERIVNAHTRGTGNYTTQIHQLLKLELIHRHFVDRLVAH